MTALTDRILIITPLLTGADGISEVSRQALNAFSSASARHDWEVEVWSLADTALPEGLKSTDGVRYRTAGGSKVRLASWCLRGGLKGQKRTLIFILHVGLVPLVIPFILRGARLAVFLHGIEVWRRLDAICVAVLRKASHLMANSRHTIDRFKEANASCAALNVEVCQLGIRAEPDESSETPRAGAFALIVGRMSAEERYKGHDTLIEIWPRVVLEVPAAALYVAGDGDDRARLESKAAALGLGNSVRFMGRVSDETLSELYKSCAFFVMPSRNEGFGLVFLEAMRAGRACIGGQGAAAEVIEDGETGIIVDAGSPEQILDAVTLLLREPEKRARMGAAGRLRVKSRFTEKHFHSRLFKSLGVEPAATLTLCAE